MWLRAKTDDNIIWKGDPIKALATLVNEEGGKLQVVEFDRQYVLLTLQPDGTYLHTGWWPPLAIHMASEVARKRALTEAPDPDLRGGAGRAWRVQPKAETPAHVANLAHWVVFAPSYHMIFRWYAISVIHLRDIEGVPPAVKHHADVTHEVVVAVLAEDPDWTDSIKTPMATPVNVSQQFVAENDADAVSTVGLLVRAVVDGCLSPDSDYRKLWTKMLSMDQKKPTPTEERSS